MKIKMDKMKVEAFAKELNLDLGIEIPASVFEQYKTLRDFKNYIMQEYYDKLVSKYSGGVLNVSPQAEVLLTKTIEYTKDLLSTALRMPAGQIETDAAFEKYGIDSIMVMELTSRLEKVFGTLSKTLLFEYRDLGSLSEYLVKNHRWKMQEITGYGASPVEQGPVKAIAELPEEEKTVKSQRGARFAYSGKEAGPASKRMEIAIVGVSGRYPGAGNIEEFWENLSRGKDSITEIPAERWNWKEYFDTDKNKEGKIYSKWGGFIDGVDEFDPLFFNISPREAEYLDPQERIFLECAYKTIEDAGYTKETVGKIQGKGMGSRIGVYAGVMYEEYQLYGAQEQSRGRMTALSASPSSIANRVSYVMNFQGPSMAVDTMCSSSLTAIHLACQSIERGECDAAIAGGVNVSIHPNKYLFLSQGKFVSSKGRCESFGSGGDGYVPGEGVGTVLLKPLRDAERDGDHIYGVIRGSMLNAGGKTNGYTVPNPQAQAELIREAMDNAGIKARQVSYLEAHGTGTSLGDPIEIGGLTKAYEKDTEERQYCAIGSVKSNIGHCESAAGIAGVTKVLLQLKHKQIAPSLHSKELNPNIDFKETPFRVQQELGDWEKPDNGPRIAGISSFGAGGANAHLLIEEYQPRERREKAVVSNERPALIVLSARDEERLKERAKDLLRAVESGMYRDEDLADIAYTLQIGREGMEERMGFTAESLKDMEEKLRSYVKGEEKTSKIFKGQIKKNREALSIITTDEEMREAVEKWIQKRKFEKIVDIWVKGYNFDFMSLYGARKPERIALPTYPFAREKYWVEALVSVNFSTIETRRQIHPLLQENISDLTEYI